MKDKIGTVSTFIGVAGVAIYLTGVAATVIPLRRDIFSDWSTAFFAANLLPKTEIVWQGVSSFVMPWVGVLIVFLVCLLWMSLFWILFGGVMKTAQSTIVNATMSLPLRMILGRGLDDTTLHQLRTMEKRGFFEKLAVSALLNANHWMRVYTLTLDVTMIIMLGGLSVIMLATVNSEYSTVRPYYSQWLYYVAGGFLIVAGSLAVAAVICLHNEVSRTRVAALILGASVFAALPYAVLTPLRGPTIEIGKDDDESAVAAEGVLLAHDSAAWYVLDVNPDRAREAPKLLAIPNAQAQKVCIWEKSPIEQIANNNLDC